MSRPAFLIRWSLSREVRHPCLPAGSPGCRLPLLRCRQAAAGVLLRRFVMSDPVKARLLAMRDALADLTDLNEAAIAEWNRRDSLQLDLEQTERDSYHARMQRLYAERDAS